MTAHVIGYTSFQRDVLIDIVIICPCPEKNILRIENDLVR